MLTAVCTLATLQAESLCFINMFAFSRKLQLKFSEENGGQENTS
jgi:hypothetical protein